MVLTRPGLADIVAAVKEGRSSFQRILTYALNMILKKIVTVLLLAIGLLMTGHAILTPLLMVIIMLTGDLLAMSLTVDNVEASRVPNVWNIGNVTIAAIAIGSLLLLYYVGMLGFAQFELRLPTEGIRTMTFLLLVFGGQSTLYAVRQRHHLFKPFPNHWLIVSSVADLSIASFLAIFGIAMAPLSVGLVGATLAASVAFGLVINVLKIPLFARLAVA